MAPKNPAAVALSREPTAFVVPAPPSNTTAGICTGDDELPTAAPSWNSVTVLAALVAERTIAMCDQAPVVGGPVLRRVVLVELSGYVYLLVSRRAKRVE